MDIPEEIYFIPAPSTRPLNPHVAMNLKDGLKELDHLKFYLRDAHDDEIHQLQKPIRYIKEG